MLGCSCNSVVLNEMSLRYVPTLGGGEKYHVWVRRPGASRAPVRGGVSIIHSPKSFTSGISGNAEESKVQAGVSETC